MISSDMGRYHSIILNENAGLKTIYKGLVV
jgi:hypothetical protein